MTEYSVVDPNEHDRFILRQPFRLVVNEYVFFLPAPDGVSPGTPFCFVRQKRFKFKEDIRFYTDETRSRELILIKARQRFDPRAKYDVTSADGSKIGQIQKVFGASLFRSTYKLYDASDREVATAEEENLGVALLRRIVAFIPYLENIAPWLPIPYHFIFTHNGVVLGTHKRQLFKWRDTYTMDLSADVGRTLDRRLILAIAVGMDALQAR
ncbi:MAG TPA: hypothetical protein VNA87_06785 [Actinomycetota bacterium]|nr:hypothetical protein [Actinomycetota bacterium]